MQGPRLYRFFNYEMPLYLPAPVAGWNPDANPWELPVNEAVQLDNFLFRPGKLVNRGPLVVSADLSSFAPLNTAGVAVTNTGYMISRKTTTGGQVDPWNVPLLLPAATSLASGNTTGIWVVGGTSATATLTADTLPGPRWVNFYGLLYGISYDSVGAAVADAQSNYFMKPLSLCTMSKQSPQGSPSNAATTFANASGAGGTINWSSISGSHWRATPAQTSATMTSQTQGNTYGTSWIESGPGTYWHDLVTTTGTFGSNTSILGMEAFLFNIPAGSIIQGVQFTIEGQGYTTGNLYNLNYAQLVYGGGGIGSNIASGGNALATASPTTVTLGGSSNLWGAALTPAIVNSLSFGVQVYVNCIGSGTVAVDLFTPSGSSNVSMSMTVWYTPPAQTNYYEATGLGFALPNTAVIQGIQVTLTTGVGSTGSGPFANDTNVQLMKGGVVQSTNRSRGDPLPFTLTANTWGGSTDLWGTSWLYSDINAANFGFAYASFGNNPMDVINATITVWYTLAGLPTITALTNAPHGSFDLLGYQGRIWLLGGIDPGGGTVHDSHALYFTQPIGSAGVGSPLGSAVNDWKDPVTGLVNKVVMDGDTSDYGVGLATVRNGLVILRRASVYLLKGSTTSNYALIPISSEIGCVDPRSIIETDMGVYFLSMEGLMLTNGTKAVNVSGNLTRTLQDAIRAEQRAVLGGKNGYATCARTSQGHLLISIGVGVGSGSGSYTPIFTAMYDPDAAKGGAWVRITSNLWQTDGTQQTSASQTTNFVQNPSFEYDPLGSSTPGTWTTAGNPGGPILSVVNTTSARGTQSLNVQTSIAMVGAKLIEPLPGTFLSGQQYTFSVDLKGAVGGETMLLSIGDVGASDTATSGSPFTLTTSWARYSLSWTPSADRSSVTCVVKGSTNATFTYNLDGALVTAGSSTTYLDGDTPGNIWAGTPGISQTISGSLVPSPNYYAGQLFDYSAPKQLIAVGDKYVTSFEDEHTRQSFLDPHAGLYDQMPVGATPFVAVPLAWRTSIPAMTTAAKRVSAQGKRYFLDHNFAASSLVPTVGWTVVPIDPVNALLDTPQRVPISTITTPAKGVTQISPNTINTGWVSGVTPVPSSVILRFNRDWWTEIQDVTFFTTWTDSARAAQATGSVAEIYGLGLEFQRARELR